MLSRAVAEGVLIYEVWAFESVQHGDSALVNDNIIGNVCTSSFLVPGSVIFSYYYTDPSPTQSTGRTMHATYSIFYSITFLRPPLSYHYPLIFPAFQDPFQSSAIPWDTPIDRSLLLDTLSEDVQCTYNAHLFPVLRLLMFSYSSYANSPSLHFLTQNSSRARISRLILVPYSSRPCHLPSPVSGQCNDPSPRYPRHPTPH